MENRTTVLYVDDNPKSSRLLTSVLEECGFRVIAKNDPVEALVLCRKTYFDLALLDYEMPAMPGSKLAQEIKFLAPDVPVVLISSRSTLPSSELALTSDLEPRSTISCGRCGYWCSRSWPGCRTLARFNVR